jgi:HD-GYP domain-containing protein (c-di-GMP phosphodiesterase class II)
MRKKITIAQLQLGMFIDELCGSWSDHPFWNARFLLKNKTDLALLAASPIRELWIDTDKGADVLAPQPSPSGDALRALDLPDITSQAERAPAREQLNVEMKRAREICNRGKTAVISMFKEARMGQALTTEHLAPLVDDIASSVLRNPDALISLARLKTKDDYTYLHSVAVCALMIALGRQLGLPEHDTREIGLAGLLHDLGKAAIPDQILNKPGKLTDQEFNIVKDHPTAGHRMLLEGQGVGPIVLDVCLHHHEKIDGSGYPERLSDEAISLHAKMGAICDVYDAITSNRAYKAGWSPSEALAKMATWTNGHLDNGIFQAFIKCIGIYPIGSLVRLESGLLGVVVESSEQSLLTPSVKTFYCTRRKERHHPKVIDLSRPNARDKIQQWESPANWPFADLDEIWSGQSAPRNESRAPIA